MRSWIDILSPKALQRLPKKTQVPERSSSDPKRTNKCEKVTEFEIVEALRRSLPIDSTQAIRKRTRAGMGHCQGDPKNYGCEERVARS